MRFFLPSAKPVLQLLLRLTEAQAEALKAHVALGGESYRELSQKLNVSDDAAYDLSKYAQFLQRVNEDEETSKEEVKKQIKLVGEEYGLDISNLDLTADIVFSIMTCAEPRVQQKRELVTKGLGNEVDDISSLVELRPVFDQARNNVDSWAVSSTIRIDYTSPSGDEDHLVLEIDEKSFVKLEAAIALLKKKRTKVEEIAKEIKLL